MSLDVLVANATNIPNIEKFGKSDPYCCIEYQGIQKKTEVKKDKLNPEWNQTLSFDLKGQPLKPGDALKVFVKDWEMVGRNRMLGTATVPLRDLAKQGGPETLTLTLPLIDSNQRPTEAKLNLTVIYKRPPGAKGGGGGGKQTSTAGDERPASEGNEDDEAEDEVDGEEEEEVDEDEDEGGVNPDGTITKKKKKKKRRGKKSKRAGKLSSKPQDFQVRIKVVEARQLPGSAISPIGRVTCYNQTKQTRVQKSTNSPYWNEVFFFNYFCSPAELFDEIVTFAVYNSRTLRSDALIGSFKCDIGMIYDESKHTLLNKWLLLSDPEDNQAGAKGYLKICASVLGPGDETVSFKQSPQNDDEDIESNLLRPAGVELRPATFKLRLYRSEDIPRMDSSFIQGVKSIFGGSDTKELVDPYFVFSFAGKKVKSEIMYNSDHPEWKIDLNIGLQFPSMCERLKLQMFDWDRVMDDDAICTAYINLSDIARYGESGFLPTFGPCFINFYGSPREYSDLPDEYDDLNLGKAEGVAYRARTLVELQTVLGETPEHSVEEIISDDMFRVQKFMRRRKYKLHAAFLNATMISAVDAPVEFEVSIGNYGNKLDESVPPCSSTTQPTNALFDGCYYYFLPWSDTKPCVVVDSHWEDISYRLETLNMLLHIADRLEENIEKVKVGIQANLPATELAQIVIALLDQVVADCSKPLPEAIEGQHVENDLDRQLRTFRETEMEYIVEQALKTRESATDVTEALIEAESYLGLIKNLSIEPQNSMPDVIIWMICGEKRVAYYRCPAHHLLWSPNPEYIGKLCGKLETIQLKYPGQKLEKEKKWDIPALLRVKLWLGLEKHEHEWHHMQTEGNLAVFAETYENQVNILGKWTTMGPLMTRPKWSDVTGKVKLKKDDFQPPPGWGWEKDWYISPELSMLYEKDAGHNSFLEDLFECQSRIPAGNWGPATVAWTDVKGDATAGKDDIELEENWEWEDDWQIDLNRAVDEEGWEYTVEATLGGYGPVEKRYHMCRRRRWVRTRNLTKQTSKKSEEKLAKEAADGWEYAPLFNMKFHRKERKMDLVRRRRWHRKMVSDGDGHACFFQIQASKDEEDEKYKAALTAPRMFLTCKKPGTYQLRAYIYQARDLMGADKTGLSDPFARIAFLNQSLMTEKVEKTVCPTWDQSLIFDQVEIHGEPQNIAEKPPEIIIEIFDHDTFGSAEFLGRTHAYPMVKLDPAEERNPVLQWYPIQKGDQPGGELLAAFELYMMNGKDLPFLPPKRGKLYTVPSGIRPVLQRTGIEVMCWGVRNMKKFQLASVTSPSIEIEVGGHIVQSKVIKNTKRNPNFDEPLLFVDIMLPKEELYTPPLNICVRDNRQFGRKPLVGVHCLKSLEVFRHQPMLTDDPAVLEPSDAIGNGPAGEGQGQQETVIEMPPEEKPKTEEEEVHDEDTDWWSKYYASTGEMDKCKQYVENGYDTFKVYDKALEDVAEFKHLNDFCTAFPLARGKSNEEEESSVVGEFKGTFRIYPLPDDPNEPLPDTVLKNLPSSKPEECIVRVYIIRAFDLQPGDPSGLADPYVSIKLGKKKVNNKDNYVPNSLDPVFGTMFEMKAALPLVKDLKIRLMDYDLLSSDDIIGETVIDLENRYLSKYRARCGLPKTYCTSGPTEWRDSQTPKDILEEICLKFNLAPPAYSGSSSVRVGNKVYNLSELEPVKPKHAHLGEADQRLALYVLNTLQETTPIVLVPEHIETRPLYNPLQPGIEQGKLQMWVDIFPQSLGTPGTPVDIVARKPKKYVLRVVIWNTKDVILDEESITGEKMSDIYVKGWIAGIEDKKETDVHYRSLDGEGNFNWRLVFPIDYIPAEECVIVKKKENFWSLDETELRLPPSVIFQIWDNDKFSGDDFLGTLEMDLHNMPCPKQKSRSCSLSQLPQLIDTDGKQPKMMSLFERKRVKGYWPCYSDEGGERKLTGKLEMELELVPESEAELRPAGEGRDEPNSHPHLDPPKRPETSFLWFTSPLKTLRYIIWRNYKWLIIIGLVVILLVLFIVLLFYSLPGEVAQKIFGN